MSRPRKRWWGFARRMIRDYKSLERQMKDLHAQSITANISGMPRGGGAGRIVESAALRQLPAEDQKVHDAVSQAVSLTRSLPDGSDRYRLIELMYWEKKSLPIKAAAMQIHVSEVTAKRWHGDFVHLVGRCYGFKDDTPEPK